MLLLSFIKVAFLIGLCGFGLLLVAFTLASGD